MSPLDSKNSVYAVSLSLLVVSHCRLSGGIPHPKSIRGRYVPPRLQKFSVYSKLIAIGCPSLSSFCGQQRLSWFTICWKAFSCTRFAPESVCRLLNVELREIVVCWHETTLILTQTVTLIWTFPFRMQSVLFR